MKPILSRTFSVGLAGLLGITLAGAAWAESKNPDQPEPEPPISVIQEIKIPAKLDLRGRWGKPKVIATADELKAHLGDLKPNEALEAVDFDKSLILIFAWAGSGQDKLSYEIDASGEKPKIIFSRTPGRTKDLRSHLHAYLVSKSADYEVAGGR